MSWTGALHYLCRHWWPSACWQRRTRRLSDSRQSMAVAPPVGFTAIHGGGAAAELPMAARLVPLRACEPIAAPHVIPLRAASSLSMAAGGGVQGLLQSFSKTTGRSIYALSASRPGTEIQTAATLCWLAGADLYLQMQGSGESHGVTAAFMDIPVYVLALSDQEKLEAPGWTTLPSIDIPALDLEARLACWTRCLPEAARPPGGRAGDGGVCLSFGGRGPSAND